MLWMALVSFFFFPRHPLGDSYRCSELWVTREREGNHWITASWGSVATPRWLYLLPLMSQRNIRILPPHLFCSLFVSYPRCTIIVNISCFPLKLHVSCSKCWWGLMSSTVLTKGSTLLSTPTLWSTLQEPAPTYLQVRVTVILTLQHLTEPESFCTF